MKMKIFIILYFMIGSLQMNLFSLIASRIEGTVVDEETGQPIVGAEVYLVHDLYDSTKFSQKLRSDISLDWADVKTDNKGFFKYDLLPSSEYFININIEGYENYGPYRKTASWIRRVSTIQKERDINCLRNRTKDRIYLKEGEIKHFKISLRKEAILEIRYTRKTLKGEEPLSSIFFPVPDNLNDLTLFSNFGSEFKLKDMEPFLTLYPSQKQKGLEVYSNLPGGETLNVEVWASGYPRATYEVHLESGKKSVIEYVLDFTRGPRLHGFIKDKSTGKPIIDASIFLVNEFDEGVPTDVDYNGEYWVGGFIPGKYTLYIRVKGKDETVSLNFKENEILELDLEY